MHVLCKSMSDGERYVIIVQVVSIVLVYVVAMYVTHKSPLVFHYLGFGCVDPVLL